MEELLGLRILSSSRRSSETMCGSIRMSSEYQVPGPASKEKYEFSTRSSEVW